MQLNEVVQEEIKAVIDAANMEIRKAWLASAKKVAKQEKDLNKEEDLSHISEANQALKELKQKISQIQTRNGFNTTQKILVEHKQRITAAEQEVEKQRRIAHEKDEQLENIKI